MIYAVECEHRDGDQIFSYYHTSGMLHFNVTLLRRLRDQMPKEFRRITLDLDQQTYDLCMQHRGIEEPKVEALTPKQLRDPGMAVMLDDQDNFTTVDGHHRLVRRYRGGVRVMDFWVAPKEIWQHCLVPYGAEEETIIQQNMPERVENPVPFASHVKVHERGE